MNPEQRQCDVIRTVVTEEISLGSNWLDVESEAVTWVAACDIHPLLASLPVVHWTGLAAVTFRVAELNLDPGVQSNHRGSCLISSICNETSHST